MCHRVLLKLVFSFHLYMNSRDITQAVRAAQQVFHPLSHLTSLGLFVKQLIQRKNLLHIFYSIPHREKIFYGAGIIIIINSTKITFLIKGHLQL